MIGSLSAGSVRLYLVMAPRVRCSQAGIEEECDLKARLLVLNLECPQI